MKTQKEWYIEINGKREGPYSISELRSDFRLTPDTLVWKKGFIRSLPIRKIRELKELFEDSKNQIEIIEELEKAKKLKKVALGSDDEIILDMRYDPRNLLLIFLLLVFILLYILYLVDR